MGAARRRKLAGDMPTEPKPQKQRIQRRRVKQKDYADIIATVGSFPILISLLANRSPKN